MKNIKIGTQVNYVTDDKEVATAFVTRIHNETCVNLHIILDGHGRDGSPSEFKSSVVYDKDHAQGTFHEMK